MTSPLEEALHARADGLFRPRLQDLQEGLVRQLAKIDSDHMSRGLYNSSARLSYRHQANKDYLRNVLEERVRSIVRTYEDAERYLDDVAVAHASHELRRITDEWQSRLLQEAKGEVEKSQLGQASIDSLSRAIERDLASECVRAEGFLFTERARHDLAPGIKRPQVIAKSSAEPHSSSSSYAHDVFLSYARVDVDRVKPIVQALEAKGLSVWWDPRILPGEEFRDVIEEALDASRSVLVVWSEASVRSRWVPHEAEEGLNRKVLVSVRIDGAKLPLNFRGVQTADLTAWDGVETRQGAIQSTLERVAKILGPLVPAVEQTNDAVGRVEGVKTIARPTNAPSSDGAKPAQVDEYPAAGATTSFVDATELLEALETADEPLATFCSFVLSTRQKHFLYDQHAQPLAEYLVELEPSEAEWQKANPSADKAAAVLIAEIVHHRGKIGITWSEQNALFAQFIELVASRASDETTLILALCELWDWAYVCDQWHIQPRALHVLGSISAPEIVDSVAGHIRQSQVQSASVPDELPQDMAKPIKRAIRVAFRRKA